MNPHGTIRRGLLGGLRWWAYTNGSADGSLKKYLYQRFSNPTRASHPVFLVGNGRSGTSMVVFQLARSWKVDLYNETHPRAFENFRLRPLRQIEDILARSYAPIVLFKPIKDTYCARLWMEHFPEARIIFVFRNPDDVIRSAEKKFYQDRPQRLNLNPNDIRPPVDQWVRDQFRDFSAAPPSRETCAVIQGLYRPDLNRPSKIALHWLFQNRLFFDMDLQKDRRVMLVHYDALVQSPERYFRAMCAFIQIPFSKVFVSGIHSGSIGRYRQPEVDAAIRDACEKLYQRLIGVSESAWQITDEA